MDHFGTAELFYGLTPNVSGGGVVVALRDGVCVPKHSTMLIPSKSVSVANCCAIARRPLEVVLPAIHKGLPDRRGGTPACSYLTRVPAVVPYATEVRSSFLSAARGCNVPDSGHFIEVCIVRMSFKAPSWAAFLGPLGILTGP